MDSPPASLESQPPAHRGHRAYAPVGDRKGNFLLSPAKKQQETGKGRKLSNTRPLSNRIANYFHSVKHN
jgi:hypothetical protein